jgi:hypothetical protein
VAYDYNYWNQDIKKFKERFAEGFDIPHCDIEIGDDYLRNIPAISWGIIQMPSQYLKLLDLHCNLILSNRNLFQNIGDYRSEKLNQEKYEIPNYLLDPESFKTKYLLNINEVIPDDKKRQKVAALIRDLITYFALYHEIGHARQLAYIPNDEASCKESQVDNWGNQAMEVDADIFAINWLCRTTLLNYYKITPDTSDYTRQELITIALYSVFLLFVLSDNNKPIINPNADYPHPVVRFEIVSIFMKEILLDNIFTIDEFGEVLKIVLPELRKTLTFHFGLDYRDYFNKFNSEELKEAKIMIDANLTKNPALNFNRPYQAE